jgi:hypothetical protein
MSRQQSPLRDRVIFVVGARRSGTNWLERILTAHPEVAAVQTETYLFSHGVQPLAERFQHANPSTPTVGQIFMPRDSFLDATRDFVDRALLATLDGEAREARYLVERTPWHASHLPLIGGVYPDAHVVNIVRDGRAVARSLVAMPWGPESIEEAAVEWRKSVEDARSGSASLPGRYRDVIYEQMLAEPRRRTAELFEWLGLDLADTTWERVRAVAGAEFNVDPGSPGINADKWRDELSATEVLAFERVAGETLDELGYPRAARAGGTAAVTARLRGALEPAAGRLRHPRATVRGAYVRASARRLHAEEVAHKQLCARFERLAASGADVAARELLDPRLLFKVDLGGGARESRGAAAADELLHVLGEHRERGLRVLTGEFNGSAHSVTTVAKYELADGSLWTRTLWYKAREGRLREVGLYRYRLPSDAQAS